MLRAARAAASEAGQLVTRQLTALAQSGLRSTLDQTLPSPRERSRSGRRSCRSGVAQQRAALATAMGVTQPIASRSSMSPRRAGIRPPLLITCNTRRLDQRADLGAAVSDEKAAKEFATAEKHLVIPLSIFSARRERSHFTTTRCTITTRRQDST